VDNSKCAAVAVLSTFLLCVGCGAGGGGSEVATNNDLTSASLDTSDVLFEPDRLLQVSIEMDPAEYELLRQDGRSFPQFLSGCTAGFEYNHFKATVSVDGEVLPDVDIRKKGFFGSLSASRPSFKMNFDTHKPGRRLESMERMTLNNNRQDPGNTHQCITYGMFRAAGLPAPRCNFAQVTVNGQDLGVYSHVESVKNHFLRRNFNSDSGNLYEAQLGDFGVHTKENLQLKNNLELNDRSDLDMVVSALQADDDNLPGLLGQVVDVDQFLSHWAMESISGHWDSATGNANNYFIYRDPSTDLFHYIPWGADGAMELDNLSASGTGPLYRYTAIPARLFKIPEYRDRYYDRVLQLLDEVWDEQALNDEVDRIAELTGVGDEELAQVRDFVARQEDRIRAAVAGELEQNERTIIDQPTAVCNDNNIVTISGSFSSGFGFFEYTNLDGDLQTIPAVASAPSLDAGVSIFSGSVSLTLAGNLDGKVRLALISIEKAEFGPGEIQLHGFATTLILIELGGSAGFGIIGVAGDGSITFDEPPEMGQRPSLHFSADLWLSGDVGLEQVFGN
jgi:spore coat protein H